ncbi:NAD(+) diphosphatase [Megasphaera vaginalis (ex Bordigoni et al. 2020)]|uniref:NAD(+) diphosphatase n=1 Tax=Megasphaera vaginalis (ex Bordigoni et al. 2020) TaxID=2045301 RepID=UPI000C7DA908|nr:NAD(+) diphosphatase [Megasphaera vaginalis (ex Bordigoni et al. 2020)]
MLQDISPHRFYNQYRPVPLQKDGFILSYRERQVLVKKDGDSIALPRFADYAVSLPQPLQWAFRIDTWQFFLSPAALPEKDEFTYLPIMEMRHLEPRSLAFAAVSGLSLHNWYENHRYCGQCGAPMKHSDTERMVHCDTCHTLIYPRICPAVIVAVRNGDSLLVSKYAGRSGNKRWALLAGFAEIGETIEETVHREVMEEVGIRVKNLTFYKSQPWGFSDSLLFGFFCDLDGAAALNVDHRELAVAEWRLRQDLPKDAEAATLTMEMISLFRQGKA